MRGRLAPEAVPLQMPGSATPVETVAELADEATAEGSEHVRCAFGVDPAVVQADEVQRFLAPVFEGVVQRPPGWLGQQHAVLRNESLPRVRDVGVVHVQLPVDVQRRWPSRASA
jgi:hypothetical protein